MSTLFPKILGQLDGFTKTSKSLGDCMAKGYEIVREPSIRTDILPKYSVGCPCHHSSDPLAHGKEDTTLVLSGLYVNCQCK